MADVNRIGARVKIGVALAAGTLLLTATVLIGGSRNCALAHHFGRIANVFERSNDATFAKDQ